MANKRKYTAIDPDNTGKKAIIIVLFVIALLGFMYFLTTRILEKESSSSKNAGKETTIQYDEILAGESFGQQPEEYLIVYYDSTEEEDSLKSVVSTYLSKNEGVRLYKVDLHNPMNKKYRTEDDITTTDASSLRVKNPTMLRFKNHQVTEVFDEKDEIKEYLSK